MSSYRPKPSRHYAKHRGPRHQPQPQLRPPVISHPGWTPPNHLIEEIKAEFTKTQDRRTASDLEAMAYLNTASSAAPLSEQWARIYFYVSRKYVLGKFKKIPDGMEFLDECKTLGPDDMCELNQLKDWIFKKQQAELEKARKALRAKSTS